MAIAKDVPEMSSGRIFTEWKIDEDCIIAAAGRS
jgi:hypothetical protein